MKQFLVYLFCSSIILQSVVGQFMLYDNSTDTSHTSIPAFSANKEQVDAHFLHTAGSTKQEHDYKKNTGKDKIETDDELPKLVSDSVIEHLFSPSNCPETGYTLLAFSNLFLGHCFDLFVIEEKINNLVHFYSNFFRNIRIGLSSTKIVYPYHNFY